MAPIKLTVERGLVTNPMLNWRPLGPKCDGRHTNNTQCMHSHTDANTSVTYERSQLLVDSNATYKPILEFQKLAGLGKTLCLNHLLSKPPSLWDGRSRPSLTISTKHGPHMWRVLDSLSFPCSCLSTLYSFPGTRQFLTVTYSIRPEKHCF